MKRIKSYSIKKDTVSNTAMKKLLHEVGSGGRDPGVCRELDDVNVAAAPAKLGTWGIQPPKPRGQN